MRIRFQLKIFYADPDFYLMPMRIQVTKTMRIRDKRPGSASLVTRTVLPLFFFSHYRNSS